MNLDEIAGVVMLLACAAGLLLLAIGGLIHDSEKRRR